MTLYSQRSHLARQKERQKDRQIGKQTDTHSLSLSVNISILTIKPWMNRKLRVIDTNFPLLILLSKVYNRYGMDLFTISYRNTTCPFISLCIKRKIFSFFLQSILYSQCLQNAFPQGREKSPLCGKEITIICPYDTMK